MDLWIKDNTYNLLYVLICLFCNVTVVYKNIHNKFTNVTKLCKTERFWMYVLELLEKIMYMSLECMQLDV